MMISIQFRLGFFRPAYPSSIVVLACFFALAGCQRDTNSPGKGEANDEHLGHVIPAHKPKDFPSAVRRLRELNTQISSMFADGKAKTLITEKTLPIAVDIANWLPEIAADSDMPEAPWDEVNDRSASLVTEYQKLIGVAETIGNTADGSALATQAGTTIKGLETLLESADPRWFPSSKPGVKE